MYICICVYVHTRPHASTSWHVCDPTLTSSVNSAQVADQSCSAHLCPCVCACLCVQVADRFHDRFADVRSVSWQVRCILCGFVPTALCACPFNVCLRVCARARVCVCVCACVCVSQPRGLIYSRGLQALHVSRVSRNIGDHAPCVRSPSVRQAKQSRLHMPLRDPALCVCVCMCVCVCACVCVSQMPGVIHSVQLLMRPHTHACSLLVNWSVPCCYDAHLTDMNVCMCMCM